MAEEHQTPTVEVKVSEDKGQGATSAGTINADTPPQDIMIPKHRFDEVSKELQELRKQQEAQAKAAKAEEERRKAAQGEWEKLATERKVELDGIAPKAALADELIAIFNEEIEEETAKWPAELKALDPGKEASIKHRRQWLKEGRKLAAQLMGEQPPMHGNGRRPQPIAPAQTAKAEETTRKQWQQHAATRYR